MAEFRYFADPHGPNSTWMDDPQECEICGETRRGYEGTYYGEEDVEFVCEPCLVSGRLAERNLTTNEGDAAALLDQLGERAGRLAEERRSELEQRTPHLVTWQDWFWPAHCGDFCRFERRVGRHELTALAPDGDGHRFYLDHLAEEPLDWELLPPSGDEVYDVGVYLFRCLDCGTHQIRWDAS